NESREAFNEKYDDIKEKLELKNNEAERLKEQTEVLVKDEEELKSILEGEKIQFLGLSYLQKNVVKELAGKLGKRFPLGVPERQKKVNSALKSAEVKKDNPKEILDEIIGLYKSEIKLTREISLQKRGFILSDHSPGEGLLLRIGTVGAAYRDEKTGRTGILLRTTNATGRLYEWREDLTPAAKTVLQKNMNRLAGVEGGASPVGSAVLPMDLLRTRAVGQGYTLGEQKGFLGASKAYFKAGGIWMWPLAIIALAALLLLLERLVNWLRKRSGSAGGASKVITRIKEGKYAEAQTLCGKSKQSVVLQALASVIANRDKTREVAEKELQEVLLQEGPALEKRLTTISVLGAAAPLLGLLGTVAGMIELFESITLYGTSDPKLMASGISIALITTQTGLAISVPIMILHNFIANRVDALINKMEGAALKALNLLFPEG
ncbi:MAG: MotA/TolQ/ExbB proton channel family protein, partial [Fibrobacteria bacterium]|nr:MotA/TolQ/ExbB proton channel family protein [Fibrobacteria bacterium]